MCCSYIFDFCKNCEIWVDKFEFKNLRGKEILDFYPGNNIVHDWFGRVLDVVVKIVWTLIEICKDFETFDFLCVLQDFSRKRELYCTQDLSR